MDFFTLTPEQIKVMVDYHVSLGEQLLTYRFYTPNDIEPTAIIKWLESKPNLPHNDFWNPK